MRVYPRRSAAGIFSPWCVYDSVSVNFPTESQPMIRPFPLLLCAAVFLQLTVQAQQPPAPLPSSAGTAYVVKAGLLIDPETGTATANQMISVKDGRIIA